MFSECTFGLMCIAITFHAIYNLLLSVGDAVQAIGLLIPALTVALGMVVYTTIDLSKRQPGKNSLPGKGDTSG